MPIWCGGNDGNKNENEINNNIYHSQSNAEDIAQVRREGFLVDDNDPAPENVPCVDVVKVKVKENGLPLDQEWGWDNTCN